MAKRIKQKGRNKTTRKRKKIVLIGSEGKNKTEKNYFNEVFRLKDKDYVCKFSTGNYTNPVGIVESTVRSIKNMGLNIGEEDLAFCVFDTDLNPSKKFEIEEAIREAHKNSIEVILSNPCFEVWFLQHFRYSTKSFQSNDEVLKELSKFIPGYKKSESYYLVLKAKENIAIENSRKLEKFHKSAKHIGTFTCKNPSTDVYKIFEMLFSE